MKRLINNTKRKFGRRELRQKQTKEEELLWFYIRNNKTGSKWKRQVSIGPYFADFYCHEKMLVIELDGEQHKDNKEYDQERTNYFESLGVRTIRFWNNEIKKDLPSILEKIKIACG